MSIITLFFIFPVILLGIGLAVGLYIIFDDRRERRADRALDRKLRGHRAHYHYPNRAGNYPYYHQPSTGDWLTAQPGNNPYEPSPTYVISTTPPAQLPPKRREPEIMKVFVNGAGKQAPPGAAPDDQQPAPPEIEPHEQPAGELPASAAIERTDRTEFSMTVIDLLSQAKSRGEAPTTAIERITGLKRGEGRAFRKYLEQWETL
jgi:hypothetical protein